MAVSAIDSPILGAQLPLAAPSTSVLALTSPRSSFVTSTTSVAKESSFPIHVIQRESQGAHLTSHSTLLDEPRIVSSRHGCISKFLSSINAFAHRLDWWPYLWLQGCDRSREKTDTGVQEIVEQVQSWSLAAGASDYWTSGKSSPEQWSQEDRERRKIPPYVLDYAPYVHLFSGEEFWPCDIAEHLVHVTPHLNYTPIEGMRDDRSLENLDELNQYGRFVYLQSDDNVEERPSWLGGSKNIPEPSQSTDRPRGHSSAPAVLVVVPKEDGVVDAFWFYFYSYNLGNKVFNVRFGNHVGDWEHSLVRFKDGEPIEVFLSEHNFGEAYSYDAVEKIGKRPVIYSATGSHAMYATPGLHPYVLPWGLLHDETDRGPLWDPSANLHTYTFNLSTSELMASTKNPSAPTNWFDFRGHWGDKVYPMSDKRQYQFAGQYHYVSGPLGARFKNLGRKKVCQGRGECRIKHWLGGEVPKIWPGGDTIDEDMNLHV